MHIDRKLMHKLFLLIAGAIVFGWLVLDTERAREVLRDFWGLFSPFAAGAAIAFVFNVPMRIMENQLEGVNKPGLRRGLAIVMVVFCLVLIVMFVFELLIPQIRLTAISLSEKIPAFVERTTNYLAALMAEHPDLSSMVQTAFNLETLNWTNILMDTLTFAGNKISSVMGSAVSVISDVTGAIMDTVIAIAFAVYCLARKEILARQGRRILYSFLPEATADELIRILRLTNSTFSNFISGQCLEACILGCLFAVTMAIFRMPYIPLVSVVIGVTALIPVVGAFVGCVVGAFFILVNDPIQALSFVALFLVLQQLENNLIYPRVVGTSIGLPGMWVLVAVTVGGEIMGVGGMLLMIPLASVCYTLAREYTDKQLALRSIPDEKLQNQPPDIQSQFKKNQERKHRIKLEKMKEKFQKLQEDSKKK